MPMERYKYHAVAIGATGIITRPGPYPIDDHARTELMNENAGHFEQRLGRFEIPNILSYDACYAQVTGHAEADGVFRTDLTATVENLQLKDDSTGQTVFQSDKVVLGIVSVYRREWYGDGQPNSKLPRVLPIECSLGNVKVKGHDPAELALPAPFLYPADRREAYLRSDPPDPAVESDIAAAILTNSSRFIYIPNFGRIFFGQWEQRNTAEGHQVHAMALLRFRLGSPAEGDVTIPAGEGDGAPTP